MNYHKLTGLVLSAMFITITVSAQKTVPVNEPNLSRPKLFTELPKEVAITTHDMDRLINADQSKSSEVSLRASGDRSLRGQVISQAVKYSNTVRSVVIRLEDYNGATLTLSSSTNADGTVNYTGRIISFQHGDLYELQKKNDQYILVRKNFYELVNE